MKVDDMDKYQVTDRMEKLKRVFQNPKTDIFDITQEDYDEVMNPAKDKDGFVHKYYLSDQVKSFIEIIIEKEIGNKMADKWQK